MATERWRHYLSKRGPAWAILGSQPQGRAPCHSEFPQYSAHEAGYLETRMLSRMSITRTLLLIAGILWVVSALLLTLGQRQDNAEIALPLPPTPVPQLHDQVPLKPDAWGENGSPYLINIWASWCVSCRAENIHLKRLKSAGIRIACYDRSHLWPP